MSTPGHALSLTDRGPRSGGVMNHVFVYDLHGGELGRLTVDRDGWDWRCADCHGCGTGYLSASAALAGFEDHLDRRHRDDRDRP